MRGRMHLLGKRRLLLASIAAAFCSPAFAVSNFTVNDTITGLGGSATFTTGTNTVTVTLNDSFATPSSLADLFSDLGFSVSGGQTLASSVDVPGTATNGFITLTNGQATSTSGAGNTNAWTLSSTGASTYLFTGLNGQPQGSTLIIGPVSSNICTAPANNNCPDGLGGGTQNFNPYINQTATFTLTIPGVTADSTISNVGFSYGTQPEVSTIPIPAAAWLFVSGLLGLIGIARRKIAPTAGPALAV